MKCAHAGCSCPAPEGSVYCSEYCRSMDEKYGKQPEEIEPEELDCRCGHDSCVNPEKG